MGDSKRARRRSLAIKAYVGPNGSGKSLAMVHDTLPSLARGRRVLSTVRILDPATGEPHRLYEPLTHWHQLLDFSNGDVLLDEVQGVASSRGHQSLPPAVLNLILQLRRRSVLLRWTAPAYGRADLVLREVTQGVTYCRGFRPQHGTGEAWPPNRWFLWRTYDALAFDEFDAGKRDNLKPLFRQFYKREKDRDQAHRWYDTLDAVDHIRDADESGTCLVCGGHRRREPCRCAKAARPQPAPAGEDGPPVRIRRVRAGAASHDVEVIPART
jgi:hypothetical protein